MYADRDSESRSGMVHSYVDAYLREEIQAEALVRDIGGYSRLLHLIRKCGHQRATSLPILIL
jgi:hypothetical protein